MLQDHCSGLWDMVWLLIDGISAFSWVLPANACNYLVRVGLGKYVKC